MLEGSFNCKIVDGKAVTIRGILSDITERKQAEEARRENEAKFRFLFASNPLPMWVQDIKTLKFIEVNDAAVAHYGYTREEFLAHAHYRNAAPGGRAGFPGRHPAS